MRKTKNFLSVLLAVTLLATVFAGCSGNQSKIADVITEETLLIAYTENNAPFFEISADGKTADGFEAEIIKKIFDSIKGECKNYKYVKVEEGYRLGEDIAYTDENGKTYIAYMAIGGLTKNSGTNNEDYSFTNSTISNRIITITAKGSQITNYSNLADSKVGVAGTVAKTAFEKHTAIKAACKDVKDYADIKTALADLDANEIDAVVIDEFNYCTLGNTDKYAEIPGELDTIEYGFATAKYDRLKEDINEAIYELKDPKYNDKDEFTPIVEQFFGYNASSFDYVPVEK